MILTTLVYFFLAGLFEIGGGYLVWLWFAIGLNHKAGRQMVVRTGRLPESASEDA